MLSVIILNVVMPSVLAPFFFGGLLTLPTSLRLGW
jgi:hypothetical protein